MTKVFNRIAVASMLRDYLDPNDPFYGYTNRTVSLKFGRQVPSNRNLIRVTDWAATALLAYQAKQYVSNKKDWASLYRQSMQDGWEPFQEEIFKACRLQ